MTIPTIITLEQAKAHLNMGTESLSPPDPSDAILLLQIAAATQLVCEHISDRNPADDAWIAEIEAWSATGSPTNPAPAIIQQAVLVQLGEFYRFRGDDLERPYREPANSLSPFVEGLLRRYHDPTVA